jgi:RNA polymerase sigma factor (sigma-70 family)
MANPTGYVYRTALNLNHKRLRHLGVRARNRPEPQPIDATATTDTSADVLRALAELPAAQREAVVLVEWLGLDATEAGRLLGIDAASVRGRLHRARQSLRERIGEIDE